ncbi:U3 small nucleolar RNA-associated protein 5 [Dioscorea alata]|uniref:U3 small nucleolar RNA-associated protein 5 n=1 Tax=Dioscorea alata TaxID=55571 RepID=A0ACB7U5L8_DIOAL|nr:U3 small nucleolar RNA-associated protein 5 [Dioscorea alata]
MSSAIPDVEVASGRRKKEKMKKHKVTDLNDSDGKGNNSNSVEFVVDMNSRNPSMEATSGARKKKKVKKQKAPDLDDTSGGNLHSEIMLEEAAQFDINEPTMEEKLASLDLANSEMVKSISEDISSMTKLPSADSVHVLLKQALNAEDHVLLLDCLYTRDKKVIAKSISLLNPADVLKLLNSLTSMVQSRGAVLVCALPWLSSLISQHASSISSQGSSLQMLNTLYQLIQSRISTFGSALQLSSSIDYLFAEIIEDEDEEESVPPPIIYEDKDTDEEESEDAMETDEDDEDLGAVIDSHDSDGALVMSD